MGTTKNPTSAPSPFQKTTKNKKLGLLARVFFLGGQAND